MAIVLALAAAAAWGWSDFLGGVASRSAGPIAVTVTSQLIGAVPLLVVALALPGTTVAGSDLVLGAAAGAGGGAGVLLLYRGLSIGRMSVVAPITAAGAAAVPVVWGVLAEGEHPSAAAWAGVALALVAIWLVSRTSSDGPVTAPTAAGVFDAIGAGLGFASTFIVLARTGADSGLWPLVPMKLVTVVLVGGLAVGLRRPVAVPRGLLRTVTAVALLDAAAVTAYLLASRRGLLALVAVVGSLYPAGTVLLARARLGETIRGIQGAGLALAAAGVVLIAVG